MESDDTPRRRLNLGGLLGTMVLRGWPLILVFWFGAAVAARMLAPSWDQIAYDGDFEYLPDDMPSVVAARLLDEAFPEERSRSQMVIVIARPPGESLAASDGPAASLAADPPAAGPPAADPGPDASLRAEPDRASDGPTRAGITTLDEHVGLDLVRRLYHRLAEVSLRRAVRQGWEPGSAPTDEDTRRLLDRAAVALDEAIAADEDYYAYFQDRIGEVDLGPDVSPAHWPRLAIAYWDRALLRRSLGDAEGAAADLAAVEQLAPQWAETAPPLVERDLRAWESLLDVLTWNDPVIGHRLSPRRARLIMLRLESELAAVSNVYTLSAVEELIETVRQRNAPFIDPGLRIVPTGTAAIGGEMLRSSADAIRYTEILTVVLILVILAVIYRSPLLVAIPVVSIVVAVICAGAVVATVASASDVPGLEWVDLKVFTTSRIFVVVILFGAGTDYCLFLIARLREEAAQRPWNEAVEVSLSRVSDALIGSAMTTVVGLAMLWVADFGKFHYSGPVIAICLMVALLVCTTLTPALLLALGPRVFWPGKIPTAVAEIRSPVWHSIAGTMTRRPVLVLVIGLGLLVPPAVYGYQSEDDVTYDISSELGPSAISRQGMALLRENLPLGETSPMTVLVVRPEPASREVMEGQLEEVAEGIYGLPGVVAVRTAMDPLGDYSPGARMGLFDRNAWRRRALQTHRISQQYFWSDTPEYHDRLVRLDVVTTADPFSASSAEDVRQLRAHLESVAADPNSPWVGSTVAIAGTTPSIMDLRSVTMSDANRIKFWVVAAVLAVLLVVLMRVGLSLYMIATVLISYYATLGMTVLFFRIAYGDTYVGLDWKVPIFLFVILVAVGQDYNVYLVTRILEEQRLSHPLAAVRRAVARTGGIITSCGVVMAGTFFSMTASAWVPGVLASVGWEGGAAAGTLRGITELGFALGLGVLLDTFYVRTVLVPAFCVLIGGRADAKAEPSSTGPSSTGPSAEVME